ncbi:MAG: preprotein translocase subunit SecG [Limisphaerales bacterium]
MGLLIGLLTLVMVLISLLLILLILVQLPKKEAGLGMAFGGATGEALFGAGTGTVLSRLTKYSAGAFLVLALVLSIMRNYEARSTTRGIQSRIDRAAAAGGIPAPLVATNLSVPVLRTPAPTGTVAVPVEAPGN